MSSLPKTMKAVQIEKTGGTDVLQYKTDVPVPEPKGDEVLVKNEFIGMPQSHISNSASDIKYRH
jgi:NADPH2:quinone reductase